MTAYIIPFPLHKARPGLTPLLISLGLAVEQDQLANLWSPLADENPDSITPKYLLDLLPEDISQRDIFSNARRAKDFSLLALFAIQTDQWNRKDLLTSLMTLQEAAEKLVPTPLTATRYFE
jgi:hypothetical protein